MSALVAVVALLASGQAEIESGLTGPALMPDCGVASLVGTCRLLGMSVTVSEVEGLLKQRSSDLSYLSFRELREAAEALGLHAVSITTSLEGLRDLPMPVILYFRPEQLERNSKVGHFVVLCSVQRDEAAILDLTLSAEIVRISLDKFNEMWAGECLIVSKTHQDVGPTRTSRAAAAMLAALLLAAYSWLSFSGGRRWANRSVGGAGAPLFLVASFLGCAREAPLSFSETSADCGLVSEGEPIDGTYRCRVWKRSSVAIRSLQASCECIVVDTALVDQQMLADSSHEIRVRLPSDNRAGLVRGSVLVATEPGAKEAVVLTLSARIVSRPRLVGPSSIIVNVLAGTIPQATFAVELRRDAQASQLKWAPASSEIGGLTLVEHRMETLEMPAAGNEAADSYRDLLTWRVKTSQAPSIGSHRFELRLAWHDSRPPLVVPVVFSVSHPLQPDLDRLFFGDLPAGQQVVTSLTFRRGTQLRQRVRKVTCDLPFVSAELSDAASEIRVRLLAPRKQGRFSGVLTIVPSEAHWPNVLVPISGIVRPEVRPQSES